MKTDFWIYGVKLNRSMTKAIAKIKKDKYGKDNSLKWGGFLTIEE